MGPAPDDATAPLDAAHSWLLGEQRGVATADAITAALLVTSGIGLWVGVGLLTAGLGGRLAVSCGLMIVYFNRWFAFIEAVNAALLVAIVWLDWPTAAMVCAHSTHDRRRRRGWQPAMTTRTPRGCMCDR